MRPFNKPPKTYEEQIQLLEERGMRIDDHAKAEHYLSHLNYYRLAGYWHIFQIEDLPHRFRPETTFDHVLNLYVFDRELRLLVLDAIERVEVSLRTQWAYQLAHAAGPHAYTNPELAYNRDWFDKNLKRLGEEIDRSSEVFIKHYLETYSRPKLPPIWAVCEIMSLGSLSHWYKTLKRGPIRSAIARPYGLPDVVLASFLHHLSHVRNRCAHHCRLWNARFTVVPELPRSKPREVSRCVNHEAPRKLYNTLVMLKSMMDVACPDHQWHDRLFALIGDHEIDTEQMGFPQDYRSLTIWLS